MAIVSHHHPYVVGVDTHARNNVLTLLASATGELIDQASFPNTRAASTRALSWVARRTGGDLATLWVIEGAATYGARLARFATTGGYQVVEAARMDSRARAPEGKDDALDSVRIAQAVLPLERDHLRQLRLDEGERAAVQVLLTARDQMTTSRTAAVNALTALLRAHDLDDTDLRSSITNAQIDQIASWRRRNEDVATAAIRAEAVRLAKQANDLSAELTSNKQQIEELVKASPAAPLLEENGFGPINTAVCLAAWSHHGRIRDEAAFAALAGTNPIPASSGNTTRHRLNRYGDRRLNSALHMAVITRSTHHPETQAYVERRKDHKTDREIRRCLKRYLARKVYRILNNQIASAA